MKKLLMVMAWLAILTFPHLSIAQSGHGTLIPGIVGRESMNLQDLNLNDDQISAIRRIKNSYVNRMVQMKTELAGKQIEFKHLVSDPLSSEESIRAKGHEIEYLNSLIIREMINHEVVIRRILTPEQLRMWCNSLERMGHKPVKLQ